MTEQEKVERCQQCQTELVKRTYEFKPGFVKITGYCLKCKRFPEFEKEK